MAMCASFFFFLSYFHTFFLSFSLRLVSSLLFSLSVLFGMGGEVAPEETFFIEKGRLDHPLGKEPPIQCSERCTHVRKERKKEKKEKKTNACVSV